MQSESNQRNIETLINLAEDLKIGIRSSVKKCCCLRFDDLIFGRLDQAKHILMETFDGKHILIDGPDGNKIDCMFFPCTSKEEVIIDETIPLDGIGKDEGTQKKVRSRHNSQNQEGETSFQRSF